MEDYDLEYDIDAEDYDLEYDIDAEEIDLDGNDMDDDEGIYFGEDDIELIDDDIEMGIEYYLDVARKYKEAANEEEKRRIIEDMCELASVRGKESGHKEGYDDGYHYGERKGYSRGYQEGKEDGFNDKW